MRGGVPPPQNSAGGVPPPLHPLLYLILLITGYLVPTQSRGGTKRPPLFFSGLHYLMGFSVDIFGWIPLKWACLQIFVVFRPRRPILCPNFCLWVTHNSRNRSFCVKYENITYHVTMRSNWAKWCFFYQKWVKYVFLGIKCAYFPFKVPIITLSEFDFH